jgi:hypothetical protein
MVLGSRSRLAVLPSGGVFVMLCSAEPNLAEDISAARLHPCSAARQRIELAPPTFLPGEQNDGFGSIARSHGPEPAHVGGSRPSSAAALHLDEDEVKKVAAL